ncbi:hypothetical protein C8Q79DRAFT_919363 [Trametes meyenii]|nr:hypothetical protein C8Q79DRAFT_919363 [Trametes meyenii]
MSSGDDGDLTQEIRDAYSRMRLYSCVTNSRLVENYCMIASSVLLFVDWCMTFTDEVHRIWRRRFTGATVVFLLTRYVALAERVVLMVSLFLPTVDDKYACAPVLRLDDALTDISYLMFGVFMMLRARGIWGRGNFPILFLALLTPIRPILSIYNQVHYTPLAFGAPLYGCGAIISNSIYTELGIVSKVIGLAIDATVLILTWIRTLGVKRESHRLGLHTPLVTLLLRDGTVYFLTILLIQICGIISVSSFVLWDVWPYFDQVFTVIFSCRFMLNLRRVYLTDGIVRSGRYRDGYGADDTLASNFARGDISGLRFTASAVGNLGAPLESKWAWDRSFESDTGETARDWHEGPGEETASDPLFVGLHQRESVELGSPDPKTPTTANPLLAEA